MFKKLLPWLLILSGCVIIGVALFQRFETVWYQNELVRQYEENAENLDNREGPPDSVPGVSSVLPAEPGSAGLPDVIHNPDDEDGPAQETNKMPEIIGTMRIPKIGLKVAVGEGSGNDSMRYTVGHFTQTAMPGQTGNFAVIGHRSYRYGQFFSRLDELAKGDEIIVKSGKDIYTYSVTESFVVNPEDTWVLEKTSEAAITLITCTPVRIATQRLIVRGILEK